MPFDPDGEPVAVELPHNLNEATAQDLMTRYLRSASPGAKKVKQRDALQPIFHSASRTRAIGRRYRGAWRIESWEPGAIVAAYTWKRYILRVHLEFVDRTMWLRIGEGTNLRQSETRIHKTTKALSMELTQEIRFVFGRVASEPAAAVAGRDSTKESVCGAMWRSDSSEQARCQRAQKRSYDRMTPVIDLVKIKPASSEAQRLRSCYAQAQTRAGTDWESTERCFHSHPRRPVSGSSLVSAHPRGFAL